MLRILIELLLIALIVAQITIPVQHSKAKLVDIKKNNKYAPYLTKRLLGFQSIDPIIENVTNYELLQYYGQMKVGDNPNPFSFLFDTGSAITWLPSDGCIGTSAQNRYKCGTTCTITNQAKSISYLIGGVSGNITTDNFAIGSASVTGMSFLDVFQEKDLSGLQSDGLAGLDVSSFYDPTQYGLLYYLYNQSQISKGIFGVYLSDNRGSSDSEIVFGGYSTSRVTTPLEWRELIDNQFWEVSMESYRIGSTLFTGDEYTAIVDTGTSFLVVPTEVLNFYLTQASSGRYCGYSAQIGLYGCIVKSRADISGFSSIYVTFGSYSYRIPTSEMIIMLELGDGTYFAAITMYAWDYNQWILGDTFIRNHYIVFDYDNKQVGFSGCHEITLTILLCLLIMLVL